jgi:hypothetical protein
MKQIIIVIFLTALFIFACEKTPSEAPYTHNAGIEGTISFEEGEADTIKALVQIANQEYGLLIDETYSDDSGGYSFSALPSTYYQLSFFADGYEDYHKRDILLESNQIHTENINMSLIQPIEFLEVVIDGIIDEDWLPVYVDENESNWSSTNDFQYLYVARDDENLYIALDVTCESQNSVNLYLDVDYGENTGTDDFTSVNQEIADGKLHKQVTTPSSFGADVGLCFWNGENSGVFHLEEGNNLNANIVRQDSILEVAIAFSELYSSGLAPENGEIAIVALIGGEDANSMANDTIPHQSEDFGNEGNRHFSTVFTRPY